MDVRKLRARDMRFVAGLLATNLPRLQEVSALRAGESEDDRARRAGKEFLSVVLQDNIDAIWSLLADLANMTPGELDEQDFSAPISIIHKVVEGDDIAGFFAALQALQATVPKAL